ncbi:MAG: hypothetical protein ACRYFZ_23650 [Janthinobacterium lividum]
MNLLCRSLFVAAWAATLPLAAQAQTTKPTAKPATKPVAKPAAKPTAKPVAKPAPVAKAPVTPPPAAPPTPAARPAAPTKASTKASSKEEPFGVDDNALNLGIGLGNRYGYGTAFFGGSSSVSPAISLSYERGFMQLGPGVLGLGAFVGYQGASYDLGGGDKWKYTDLIVTLRGAFHYPVTPQFDAYGGVGLGVRHAGASYEGSGYGGVSSSSSNEFASGLFVGGRYFFTPSIGAFAELGYDQTFLKIGLSAKF